TERNLKPTQQLMDTRQGFHVPPEAVVGPPPESGLEILRKTSPGTLLQHLDCFQYVPAAECTHRFIQIHCRGTKLRSHFQQHRNHHPLGIYQYAVTIENHTR